MFSTSLRVGVGVALVVLGLSVMSGWIFDVGILKSVLPRWPPMKFNPALCFVLLGLAFILTQRPRASARIGAVICGVAVTTIAGATLAEYLSGRDFGIDQLLVADKAGYSGSGLPGRMSPLSALAFVLKGMAVILLSVARRGPSVGVAHVMGVCAGLTAFLTAAGYAFGAETLGPLGVHKLMAVHTAIAHTAACIVILATRAQESWLAGYEQAPTARAALLRLLPVSVGLPSAIGLALLLGAGLGLYNAEFALALFIPLLAVLLIALGLRAGQHVRDGEVALRASQAQLRERASLVDLSHDAVFTLDMGAVILSWNRGAEALYGWPRDEAIGKVVHDFLETTFPEPIEDIYATLHRTGRWEGELVHKKRDGTHVIAASRWSLHRDRQGQPVAILETNNDVTEQHRAMEELARSELKYRDLFDHLPIAVVQTDTSELLKEFDRLHAEGVTDLNRYIDDHPDFLNRCASLVRVTQINAEAVKLFGPETAAEFMGNVARFFDADPDTMRRNAVARFSGEESITQEMRTVTLDGQTMHLLYKNTFSRALSEMGIGLLAMIDITERRRAQESLQQAQSDLARYNRVTLMGEMTASISHEINQPISGAITNANAALHWLVAEPPNIEEVRKSLERIVKDGHRASEVIERVRALARKTPPRKDPLDINQAVGEVLALAERELRSNSIKVSVRLSRELPLVPADRIQVQQVVLNLVVNAIEAMCGTSAAHRQLSVSTGRDSADVFVEVRDTGSGLGVVQSERLFQSFYTTKDGGMGMGLSLSRSIVEAHGGRLSAAPNKPNGAIFRFTLPVVDPSMAEQDA